MKIWFIRAVALTWVTTLSLACIAQNDKEAIKQIIAKETIAFLNVEYKEWSDCWLKVPYSYWSYSDSTTISRTEGWDQMDKMFAEYFKNARPSTGKVSNEWIEFRIYENGAYVRFVQKVTDDYETSETSQIRILEKKDGLWKVVCVWAIARYPDGGQ
ncbi:MAG: hypothetical protein JNL53_04980 [Cyclobacteriaceae bacterium]|nr:hypothetical protein [Cyclobacteriaceae bacterium]